MPTPGFGVEIFKYSYAGADASAEYGRSATVRGKVTGTARERNLHAARKTFIAGRVMGVLVESN